MHTLQNTMPDFIHLCNPLRGGTSPREKYHSFCPLLRHNINHLLRELLPAFARVAVCLVRPHGQTGIQEQHASIGPGSQQAAAIGRRLKGIRVFVFEELVYILEGRWGDSGRADGEAEAVGLVVVMVGVLA